MYSIIIPTLNNKEYLKICIESLIKNSKFKNQIIVHVNIGSDNTIKYLNSKKISYTFSKKNIGLCSAVNLAAKKSKHDYIVYSHDDFYFCPDWDKALFDEIKEIGHKKFYLSSTQVNTFGIKYFNCGKNFNNFNKQKLLKNLTKIKFPDIQGSTWAPHVVHRKFWIKCAGFSEEFFPGAGSDPDFVYKLWLLGIRIFKMLGSSKVYHFESKTLRDSKKFKFFKGQVTGSESSKLFLLKWGISTKFLKKHYLRSNSIYRNELSEPKKNLTYISELLICKMKYLYLKLFSKIKYE